MDIVATSTSSIANLGSLYRFVVVCVIFAFNLMALFRLTLCRPMSYCLHSIVYGCMLLLAIIFLVGWLPYLFSSFLHATAYPIFNVHAHCTAQHLINMEVSTFLVVVLTSLKVFQAFAFRRVKLLYLTILFAWVVPQSIYLMITEVLTINGDTQHFLLDNYHHSGNDTMATNKQQGVLLCVYGVNVFTTMVNNMIWHYVVLVLPLTFIFILCVGASLFSRLPFVGNTCTCGTDMIVNLSLYSNFMWLLFLRPVLALISLIRAGDAAKAVDSISSGSLTIELGSHLILFAIALGLPFSTKFGIFSSIGTATEPMVSSKNRTKSMNAI